MRDRQGIRWVGIWRRIATSKRKDMLNKGDMTGYVNTTREKIKTAITLLLIRITKKHTWNEARCEFVWRGGRGVGKAKATEDTKFRIIWMTEKK